MQVEELKLLEDTRQSAGRILAFIEGQPFERFRDDALLRSAVERQFEIIGEALNRLERRNAELASRITDSRRIIAFRNILIHGYDNVDVQIVWEAATVKLPTLKAEVKALLA